MSEFTEQEIESSEAEQPPKEREPGTWTASEPPTDARADFDAKLAARLTQKNLEIIELRIALARADEARRSYLNILVFCLMLAAWVYIWRSTLPD